MSPNGVLTAEGAAKKSRKIRGARRRSNSKHQSERAPKEARTTAAETMPEITPYGIDDSASSVLYHARKADAGRSAAESNAKNGKSSYDTAWAYAVATA